MARYSWQLGTRPVGTKLISSFASGGDERSLIKIPTSWKLTGFGKCALAQNLARRAPVRCAAAPLLCSLGLYGYLPLLHRSGASAAFGFYSVQGT